jgi:hypothetical protein
MDEAMDEAMAEKISAACERVTGVKWRPFKNQESS